LNCADQFNPGRIDHLSTFANTMHLTPNTTCIAFAGTSSLAEGPLSEVALAAKRSFDQPAASTVLIFDMASAEQIDLSFEGSEDDFLAHLGAVTSHRRSAMPAEPPRAVGRPKLGVTAREVTLLPRHWEWLNSQPGGASATLRKLVEYASRSGLEADEARRARDATYRFIHAIAGNEPGFEEASRALFATDPERFRSAIASWPADVRAHAERLSAAFFGGPGAA
jgi:hypothetical protein